MPYRILLLDDEPDLLRALSVRFTAAGFTCEAASNGQEGMVKIRQALPDLIITDLAMPEMDGYEMVRRLKADAQTASIPIIVLTAIPKHAIDRRAKELEGTCVMHKPFEFHELLSITRELLSTTVRGGPPHG